MRTLMQRTAIAVVLSAAGVVCGPTAHADQPQFPDLSGYTPVNPQDYIVDLPNPGRPYPLEATRFWTPDGILCTILDPEAGCLGNNFPDVPPAAPAPGGGPRVNAIATDHGIRPTAASNTPPMDPNQSYKTLPPFHSITVNGVICAVDNARVTACKDPVGQGFVLSPRGSGWLAYV
jgi:hypothetical protein